MALAFSTAVQTHAPPCSQDTVSVSRWATHEVGRAVCLRSRALVSGDPPLTPL